MDPLDGLLLRELIAIAEPRDEDRALLLSLVTCRPDSTQPGAIDRDRLLDEEVLARVDGSLDVQRTEVRRGRQEDDVTVVDDALIGVKADELVLRGDVHSISDVRGPRERAQRVL